MEGEGAGWMASDYLAMRLPLTTDLRSANDPQCTASRIGPALTGNSASVIVIPTTADPSYPIDDPDACPQAIDRPAFQHSVCGPLRYKSQFTAP